MNLKQKIQKISRRAARSPDDAEFGISRFCLAEDGKEINQEL